MFSCVSASFLVLGLSVSCGRFWLSAMGLVFRAFQVASTCDLLQSFRFAPSSRPVAVPTRRVPLFLSGFCLGLLHDYRFFASLIHVVIFYVFGLALISGLSLMCLSCLGSS